MQKKKKKKSPNFPIALYKSKTFNLQCSISYLIITYQTEHIWVNWQSPVGDWRKQQQIWPVID